MALQEISPSELDFAGKPGSALPDCRAMASGKETKFWSPLCTPPATSTRLRRPHKESLLMSITTGEVQFERGFHLILLDSHL